MEDARSVSVDKKNSDTTDVTRKKRAKVEKKLRWFVKNFVYFYEKFLTEYYTRLEENPRSVGKLADDLISAGSKSMKIDATLGVTSLISATVPVFHTVIKTIDNKKDRDEIKKKFRLLRAFKHGPEEVRSKLVEAGIEIFQKFEYQFMGTKVDGYWERALTKLAHDAVNRSLSYSAKYPEKKPLTVDYITKGVVLGDSKKYGNPFQAGHTVVFNGSDSWNTGSLFKKIGLLTVTDEGRLEKCYLFKKKKQAYGFRLSFEWENKENQKEINKKIYQQVTGIRIFNKYFLNSAIVKTLKDELITEINREDPKSIETRFIPYFKTEIEQIKQISGNDFKELQIFLESNQNLLNNLMKSMIDNTNKSNANHEITHTKLDEINIKIDKKLQIFQNEENKFKPVNFDLKETVTAFTGRTKELLNLHKMLHKQDETKKQRIVAITGMGGLGKSELAKKYIKDHIKDYDSNAIWINAENDTTLDESFRRLAGEKLRIKIKDNEGNDKDIKLIIEDVYNYFAEVKSIFVFDNVEKTNDNLISAYKFLPDRIDNKPYVIITSREQKWDEIPTLPLSVFTEVESEEFIIKKIKDESVLIDNGAKKLSKKLGYYPLALQQAVALIEVENESSKNLTGKTFTVSHYLEKYKAHTAKILAEGISIENRHGYNKCVMNTWQITIDKIENIEGPVGRLALKFLHIMAYLAPDKIPIEKIFPNKKKYSANERNRALDLLGNFSLVNYDHGNANIHRLVQQYTRTNLENQNASEKVLSQTFKRLRKFHPYKEHAITTGKLRMGQMLKNASDKKLFQNRKLMPHLEALLSHVNGVCSKKIGNEKQKFSQQYLCKLLIWMSDFESEYDRKEDLLKRALEIQKESYKPDKYYKMATTFEKLAKIKGTGKKNLDYLQQALTIKETHYGLEHDIVAKSLIKISDALWNYDLKDTSQEYLQRALKIYEKRYGTNHYKLAEKLPSLAIAYYNTDNREMGLKCLERGLKIYETKYGPDHHRLAVKLEKLSTVYKYFDENKSYELLERALIIDEKHYGSDHYLIAQKLKFLGFIFGECGETEKCLKYLQRSLKIYETQHDDHRLVNSLIILGVAFGKLGNRCDKGRDCLDQAYFKIDELYANKFPLVHSKKLEGLSDCYQLLDAQNKSLNCLKLALKNYEAHDKLKLVQHLKRLGPKFASSGEKKKVIECWERIMKICEKKYGHDSYSLVNKLKQISDGFKVIGEKDKCLECLKRVVEITKMKFGPDSRNVVSELRHLGRAYTFFKDEKSLECLEQVLAINQKNKGPDSFELVEDLKTLSRAYKKDFRNRKSLEYLEQVLAIREKRYGALSNLLFDDLKELSKEYQDFGENNKRLACLKRCLEICERDIETDYNHLFFTLSKLGEAYLNANEINESQKCFERALEIEYNMDKEYNPLMNLFFLDLETKFLKFSDHTRFKLEEQVLAIYEKRCGPKHPTFIYKLIRLSQSYDYSGDVKNSAKHLERALLIQESISGPEDDDLEYIITDLAILKVKMGEHEKVKALLEGILPIQEKKYGHDSLKVFYTIFSIGNAYELLNDREKAYNFYKQAGQIYKKLKLSKENDRYKTMYQLNKFLETIQIGTLSWIHSLINHGLDILERSQFNTVLHRTASNTHHEVLRFVLDEISKQTPNELSNAINARDSWGNTPLFWALRVGNITSAKILVEYGADIKSRNNVGPSELFRPLTEDRIPMFLDEGDTSIKDDSGQTLLEWAEEKLSKDPNNNKLKKVVDFLKLESSD